MPNPDAQDAPVASQEAEARIAEAYLELRRACAEFSVAPPAWAGRRIDDANDAYVAAIRASERAKVEAQYASALITADSMMTLLWYRYRHVIPAELHEDWAMAIQQVTALSRSQAAIDAVRAGSHTNV